MEVLAVPVQGAVNAQLRADLDAPVGRRGLLVSWSPPRRWPLTLGGVLAAGARVPAARSLGPPGRCATGGAGSAASAGAAYVTSVFLLIPELGAAPVVALTVGGQQLASVAVDRYGWLRLARRDISLRRLLGVAVLLAGVAVLTLA